MTATTRVPPARSKTADNDSGEEAPKKSKKKLIIIMVVVLLLVAFVAKKELLKPHYRVGQAVPAGKIDTLGELTINLSDGHLAQVTVVLQLTKVAAPKVVGADVARFEDAVTTAFGTRTYAGLLKPSGRVAVKAQILQLCQKITGPVDGAAPQISAVYFDGFVIQ